MSQLPIITLKSTLHHNKEVILLQFDYDNDLIAVIRPLNAFKWSQTHKSWYISKYDFDVKAFYKLVANKAEIVIESLSVTDTVPPINKEINNLTAKKPKRQVKKESVVPSTRKADIQTIVLPEGYIEKLERKRYSDNTINTYSGYMRAFIRYFKLQNIDIDKITTEQINDYILLLIKTKKISPSQQNQHINAIKFYYEKVLGRVKEFYNIERPKKSIQLPKVLSEDEIMRILKCAENIKHKAILGTIYSAGLRRSELVGLRKEDILFDKNIIFVRGAKGKKDRTSILSDSVAIVLKRYLEQHKPNYWLFEGPYRRQYSTSSVAMALKKAAQKAGINRNVTPHMLRHSFATHLLEQGVDIRYIQHILGHESSRTTEIYTHISKKSLAKIKSPLDTILNDN